MISDNQMDIYFNDRLRNYSSSVPADMWNRIIEKKKRDRILWLFFFRLFAIAVLAFGLKGGYLIFNQKKSTANIKPNVTGINQTPVIGNTTKTNLSNPLSGRNQLQLSKINIANNKMHQKKNSQINYSEDLEKTKMNTSENIPSSQFKNTVKSFSGQKDSNVIEESKTRDKIDSTRKKPFVKSATPDSSVGKQVKKPEKQNKLNNSKWYLDLYASPDYPIVSPHGSGASKLSYTIGIKLNRSLGQHFSVKTGIQYSRLNIVESDSGLATLHLNRLDMPVLAGYSMGNKNLKMTINGGAIFSWLLESNANFLVKNTSVSLYLGINFEEKINENISLFAEPYYRYQLTNMTTDTIPFVKFVDLVGINIGVRFHLMKKH